MLWAWRICTFRLVGMSLARSKAVELGFEKKEGPVIRKEGCPILF